MKKIIINEDKFKNNIKYKLICASLSSILLLTGCRINRAYKYNYTNPSQSTSVSSSTYVDKNKKIVEDEFVALTSVEKSSYSPTFIQINDVEEFIQYINSLEVQYDFEKVYSFDKSLSEYNKLNLTTEHKNSLKEITLENLINVVKQNNNNYKKSKKLIVYKELNDDELKDILSTVVETVNDFINSNNVISSERIKCVLSELKVFKQDSALCNAFVSDDNCLVISPNMLKIAKMINGSNTDKDVLIHEIIHLLQKGCNCDLNKNSNLKRNFGVSFGFKDLDVNSLDFTWIYESAAEKMMTQYTKHEPLVYKNMIGYLESLSLANLLNDNYNVNDTEKLTFKHDLNALYEYFNAYTESEKKEVLNLMYSIEVMQQKPDDFYKKYTELTGRKEDSELGDEMNYNVKSSVCKTLSKLFYKNLATCILNKSDVTLEDAFYLISLFENDINNHVLYNRESKLEYNKEFIDFYLDVQSNFFYLISKENGLNQEDIEDMFCNYSAKKELDNGKVINNYNLSFIDTNKAKYLKERQQALKSEATSSIFSVKQHINESKEKVYSK